MFDRLSAISFDAGAANVRALQLRVRAGIAAVHDGLLIPTDASPAATPNTSPSAPPQASDSRDCRRLARFVTSGVFRGRDVGLVVGPPDVRFHALRLPDNALAQPPALIESALMIEAAREARVEPAELELRYWRLPTGHQNGANVMAVSIPIRRAAQWFDEFQREGVSLRGVFASPCAALRAARTHWTPKPRDLWAILDLGFRSSLLTVVVGDTLTYVRTLSACGDAWTRGVAGAFDASYSEAEQIKRAHGIGLSDDESESAAEPVGDDDASVSSAIFGLIRDRLDELVREIDLCCSYVVQSYPDVHVNRLLLCGGGANLAGLDEYLALHLGIPVRRIGDSDPHPEPADGKRVRGAVRGLRAGTLNCENAVAIGAALLDLEAA